MDRNIDRRTLLKLGTVSLGLLGAALQGSDVGGFTHGVASGEPGPDSILLWTRFKGDAGAAHPVTVEVSEHGDFRRIVARQTGVAEAANDFCVKIPVSGLRAGRHYHYRFIAPDGVRSIAGRTRTLPRGRVERFRIAVFSCSDYSAGLFNAYAHALTRDDIDLVVHLGDYIYEYGHGGNPTVPVPVAGRIDQPANELVQLSDYRQRYASYRTDPDLLELHRLFPTILLMDDHDIADDAWRGGARNHRPDEGPWEARQSAARTAFRNWLPVSDADYAHYAIGDLLSLMRLDTRMNRDRQHDLVAASRTGEDRSAALVHFRENEWSSPDRTMLGLTQEQWLAEELARSVRDGVRWQVVAQQVVMGMRYTPSRAVEWLSPTATANFRRFVETWVLASSVDLPQSMDAWSGYPAARSRQLRAAIDSDANLVVLSGDSHNAWAFELSDDDRRAGVEFAVQAVTSSGMEGFWPQARPEALAAELVTRNPELRWCNPNRRGYMTVDFSRSEASATWHFLETVGAHSVRLVGETKIRTRHGSRRLSVVRQS